MLALVWAASDSPDAGFAGPLLRAAPSRARLQAESSTRDRQARAPSGVLDASGQLDEGSQPCGDLYPGPPESLELLLVGAIDLGRVVETPMQSICGRPGNTGHVWRARSQTVMT